MDLKTLFERQRRCGYRKPGGLYLICDQPGHTCGKLPLALVRCPVCGAGIKPTRGFAWIEPGPLFYGRACNEPACGVCGVCALRDPERIIGDRAGLVWIGEKFYDPDEWMAESVERGVSRRIPAVPKDFVIGEHWVFAGHRRGITMICTCKSDPCPVCKGVGWRMGPALIHAFRPDRIEYVVTGHETDAELERLVKRGVTPVRVIPVGDDGRPLEPLLADLPELTNE